MLCEKCKKKADYCQNKPNELLWLCYKCTGDDVEEYRLKKLNDLEESIAITCDLSKIITNEIIFNPHVTKSWLMKLSDKGLEFNRKDYPNLDADGFAKEVMEILEKMYVESFTIKKENKMEKTKLTITIFFQDCDQVVCWECDRYDVLDGILYIIENKEDIAVYKQWFSFLITKNPCE